MRGKVSVLVGPSGVGKSSLINALRLQGDNSSDGTAAKDQLVGEDNKNLILLAGQVYKGDGSSGQFMAEHVSTVHVTFGRNEAYISTLFISHFSER